MGNEVFVCIITHKMDYVRKRIIYIIQRSGLEILSENKNRTEIKVRCTEDDLQAIIGKHIDPQKCQYPSIQYLFGEKTDKNAIIMYKKIETISVSRTHTRQKVATVAA